MHISNKYEFNVHVKYNVVLVLSIVQRRWPIWNWLQLETGLQFERNGSAQCNIFGEGSSKPSEASQSSIPSSLVRFIGDSVVTSCGCGSLYQKVIC